MERRDSRSLALPSWIDGPRLLLLLLTGILIGALLIPSLARSDDPEDRAAVEQAKALGRAFAAISEEIIPSVVTITSAKIIRPAEGFTDERMRDFFRFFGMPRDNESGEMIQRGLGSGVIVSRDGYIVTNNHVVSNAKEISVVMSDGSEFQAEVIGNDPKTDVAVIRIDAGDLPAARLGDVEDLDVGEWVLAVGSPFSQNLNHTVTAGIVSAKSRSAVGLADYEDFIQTDAAINPGNSGGALVNLDGEVVGINTAIASRTGGSQGVGFAIPINMVNRIMTSLIEEGAVTRGWIGIGIQPVTREIQEALDLPDRNGVLISGILDDSPADDADLRRQDVIVGLNGRKVESLRAFRNEIAATEPGTDVRLEVMRKGKVRDVRLALGRLPDDDAPPPVASRATREKLGIEASAIDAEARRYFDLDRRDGVVITDVRRGSPAAQNGLREGDVILEIGDQEIESLGDYHRAVRDAAEGDVVLFFVEREGSTFFVALRIPEE